MAHRRRLSSLLLFLLLLAALTVGGVAATGLLGPTGAEPGGSAGPDARAGAEADTARERASHRRIRRHVDATAGADATDSGDAAADRAGDGGAGSGGDTDAPDQEELGGDVGPAASGLVAGPPERFPEVEAPDGTIIATLERDAQSGEAVDVAASTPEALAIERFVAGGTVTVDGARELVGERKPKLDEGITVSLTGRVFAADDGLPVSGAQVFVTSTFYVRQYMYDHHLREVARAETGADGAFRIEGVNVDPAHFGRGGRLFATVSAPGFATALDVPLGQVSPGVANRLQDVKLARATETLTGVVVDQWDKQPVAGARIYATGAINPIDYPKDQRAALFLGAPTTVSDENGNFTLEGLAKGLQTISAHGGDDCVGVAPARLPLEGAFTLPARHIRGRIEGVCVDARDRPVPLVAVEGGDNSTHSFADGHFVLENFRGDVIPVRFLHPDFELRVMQGIADGTTGLVVRLDRKLTQVLLDVRDIDTDAPVPHVEVTFAYPEGVAPPPKTSPHRLEKDGRYRVTLPDGSSSFTVAADGFVPQTFDCAGRANGDVVIALLRRPE